MLEAALQRGLVLDAFGEQREIGTAGAPAPVDDLEHVLPRHQHIQLDDRGEADQLVGTGYPDEVVQGDPVAGIAKPAHAVQHLGVETDRLEHLEHRLIGCERYGQVADQERPGEVDESGTAAQQVGRRRTRRTQQGS